MNPDQQLALDLHQDFPEAQAEIARIIRIEKALIFLSEKWGELINSGCSKPKWRCGFFMHPPSYDSNSHQDDDWTTTEYFPTALEALLNGYDRYLKAHQGEKP